MAVLRDGKIKWRMKNDGNILCNGFLSNEVSICRLAQVVAKAFLCGRGRSRPLFHYAGIRSSFFTDGGRIETWVCEHDTPCGMVVRCLGAPNRNQSRRKPIADLTARRQREATPAAPRGREAECRQPLWKWARRGRGRASRGAPGRECALHHVPPPIQTGPGCEWQ